MIAHSPPAVLGEPRTRPVDAYRDVIERYHAGDILPLQRLEDRDGVIDALTEWLRPLLDAIVDAEAANREVERASRLSVQRAGSSLGFVARLELARARDRRRLALGRLREMLGDERTILRYFLLRELLRIDGASPGALAVP